MRIGKQIWAIICATYNFCSWDSLQKVETMVIKIPLVFLILIFLPNIYHAISNIREWKVTDT